MSAPHANSVLSAVLDRQTKELLRLREEVNGLKVELAQANDECGKVQADCLTAIRQRNVAEATLASVRAIFPEILTAIGNGAFCSPDCSVEFLREIPKEVRAVIDRLARAGSAVPVTADLPPHPDTVRLDDVLNTLYASGTTGMIARYQYGIECERLSREHIDRALKGPSFYEFIAEKVLAQVIKASAQ